MKTKVAVETLFAFEQSPLVYARTRSEIPKLVSSLASDIVGLLGQTLRIPQEQAVPFEGGFSFCLGSLMD
jgi:hypothetical protein